VYAGTIVCSAAQTFILSVPPLLSSAWYGEHERAVATSIGVVANQIGVAFGLGGTFFMNLTTTVQQHQSQEGEVNNEAAEEMMVTEELNEEALKNYISIQMAISILALLLICLFVQNHPPSPSSNNENDDANDEEKMNLKHMSRQATTSTRSTADISITTTSSYNSIQELSQKKQHLPVVAMSYLSSIATLLKSPSGLCLTMYYGCVVGVFYALETFLSQFVLWKRNEEYHHEWTSSEAGLLGLIIILVGCVGNIVSGYQLDHSITATSNITCAAHQKEEYGTCIYKREEQQRNKPMHKEITAFFTIGSILSMAFFATSVLRGGGSSHKYLVYLTISSCGFFLSGLTSIGFEYACAITYPADEAAVAGVLNVAAQIGGWILLIVGGRLSSSNNNNEEDDGGVGWVFNLVLTGTLIASLIILMVGVNDKSIRP